ncbi:hypothetical protein F4814DRAFT_445064 [Daldinia grandis]|nr:hypothetical protein F4814DRAFT_445064 [Daldinia grandis]
MVDSGEGYWSWIQQNPKKTAVYATAGLAIAAPMVIAAPILGAFGFGASGIAAGSVAAGAQTANVAAGSLFAILQSAGMGGYGAATVGGVVQASGFLGGIYTAWRSKAPDRRSLNPIENIWDSSNDNDSDDGGDDDANDGRLNSKPMSRYDIVKAANWFWGNFLIEELVTIMNMMPQLIERLKEMKGSMLGY